MLLYQSYKVGTVDYETLGHAVGGPFWKVSQPHICQELRRPFASAALRPLAPCGMPASFGPSFAADGPRDDEAAAFPLPIAHPRQSPCHDLTTTLIANNLGVALGGYPP